jgi:hypothetical protein
VPRRPIAIVVDSSVARSSGQPTAIDPVARACREAILELDAAGLCIVMTSAIQQEWKKHQSNFARRWLLGMYAQRRVVRLIPIEDVAVREGVSACQDSKAAAEMTKDLLLVDAALATSSRIISRDARARECFRGLVSSVRKLKRLHWVSPAQPDCVPWLAAMAPERHDLTLGGTGH